eukprot:3719840-Prymnesium_polylepis.1
MGRCGAAGGRRGGGSRRVWDRKGGADAVGERGRVGRHRGGARVQHGRVRAQQHRAAGGAAGGAGGGGGGRAGGGGCLVAAAAA